MLINLANNKEKSLLLIGVDKGKSFISKFQMKDSEKIKFIDDNNVVVSNSYFYGIIRGLEAKKFKTKAEILDFFDFKDLSDINQKEFIRAVNREMLYQECKKIKTKVKKTKPCFLKKLISR